MVEAEWTVRDKAQNDWSRPEIHAVYNPPLLDLLFHEVPAGGRILEGAACGGGKQGRRDGSRVRCRVWTTAVDPDDTERPTCSRPRRCCPPRWASWRSVDLDEAADPGWRPCPESAAWWWRCRCGGAQIRLVGFVHLRWEEVVRCASKNSSPMPASGHGSWWFTPRT
jgi:hypothetical protein